MARTQFLLSKPPVRSVLQTEALGPCVLRSQQSREEELAVATHRKPPILSFADFSAVSQWCLMYFCISTFLLALWVTNKFTSVSLSTYCACLEFTRALSPQKLSGKQPKVTGPCCIKPGPWWQMPEPHKSGPWLAAPLHSCTLIVIPEHRSRGCRSWLGGTGAAAGTWVRLWAGRLLSAVHSSSQLALGASDFPHPSAGVLQFPLPIYPPLLIYPPCPSLPLAQNSFISLCKLSHAELFQ